MKKEREREPRDSEPIDMDGDGDDYQFEKESRYLVHKFLVVGDSEHIDLRAVDWSKDQIEGKMLIAA